MIFKNFPKAIIIVIFWCSVGGLSSRISSRNLEEIPRNVKSFKDNYLSPKDGGRERAPSSSLGRRFPERASTNSRSGNNLQLNKNSKVEFRSIKEDAFVDFYEAAGPNPAPYMYVNDVVVDDDNDDYNTAKASVLPPKQQLMSTLVSILQTGKLRRESDEKKSIFSVVQGHNLQSVLHSEQRQDTFLEIGTGVTSLHLAEERGQSQRVIAALIVPDSDLKTIQRAAKSHTALIGTMSPKAVPGLVKSLLADPQVLFGSILVSNISALIGDNLPHEFEKLLGRIFTLAKETYIAPLLMGNVNTASFLRSWNGLQDLAQRSCSAVAMSCAVTMLSGPSWDVPKVARVTLLEGQRPLDPRFCCEDSIEECVMSFRTLNGSDEVLVAGERQRGVTGQRSGILLSTLLQLSLVRGSLERLMVPLLEMTPDQSRLARNIMIYPNNLILHSQLPDCQEATYKNTKTQQEREITRVVAGESQKVSEYSANQSPWKYQRELKKFESDLEKDRRKSEWEDAAVDFNNGGDKNLLNTHTVYANNDNANMNMHAKYANNDNVDMNMHAKYANNDNVNMNMHAKYANKEVRDMGGEAQGDNNQLIIQGKSARQSVDGVFRRKSSAINENQRDNRNIDSGVGGVGGKEDAKVNGVGLENSKSRDQYVKTHSLGLQDARAEKGGNVGMLDAQSPSRNQRDGQLKRFGLQQKGYVGPGIGNGARIQDAQSDRAGLQQMQAAGLGEADGDERMWYSSMSRAAAHEEGSPSRRLEWEKAREELDGYRGAGPQVDMKSQVDAVADLWQRENEEQPPDNSRNSDIPGSHWDRETESDALPGRAASKLVAIGNLLTRDEDNSDGGGGNGGRGGGGRRDGGEIENLRGDGEKLIRDANNNDRTVLKKQRRKQFRNAAESNKLPVERTQYHALDGGEKSGNSQISRPLTPTSRADVKQSQVERGLERNSIKEDGKLVYKQRQLLQFFIPEEKQQAQDEVVDDDDDEEMLPVDVRDELQARRRMLEAIIRRDQEQGTQLEWEQAEEEEEDDDQDGIEDEQGTKDYYGHEADADLDTNVAEVAVEFDDGGLGNGEDDDDAEMEEESKNEEMDGGQISRKQKNDLGYEEEEMKGGKISRNQKNDLGNVNEGKVIQYGGYGYGVVVGDGNKEKDAAATLGAGRGLSRANLEEGFEDDDDVDDDEEEDEEEELGRMLKDMLKSKQTEGEEMFDTMWQVLEDVFQKDGGVAFSLMTYGGKEQSLVGAKVARAFPQSSVLTVIPAGDPALAANHRSLQESLQLSNNMLVSAELTDGIVSNLYQQMAHFRFQILGLAAFQKLATYGRAFPAFLGRLLALSQTTFIEVPHPVTLVSLQAVFPSSHGDESSYSVYRGFLSAALEQVGIFDHEITVLSALYLPNHARVVRVELQAFNRQVYMDCLGTPAWFQRVAPSQPLNLVPLSASADGGFPLPKVGVAITLQTLLTLGLSPNERKLLFREYLKLPIHSDMCPMSIVWQGGRLLYSPFASNLQDGPNKHVYYAQDGIALLNTFTKQLQTSPFSFLEYGPDKDGLIISLASKYPNSTFVLFAGSDREAEKQQGALDSRNMSNVVITSMAIDESLTSNLASSPDFLRYQYIGMNQFFSLIAGGQRESFKSMLGDIVSTGVTSFLQLPSSQMLSLAISTFFPEVIKKNTNIKDLYSASSHPHSAFKNYELRLVKENMKMSSGLANVSAGLVRPSVSPDGSLPSWSLVRLDLRRLSTMVDHHFMYVLDGHNKKYYLHCRSNLTHHEVYLVRAMDGFKIPYQEIKGFSLIALLRMGLLPDVKESFYTQFLSLPLYPDMAPWNIAGRLEYIDYDSKHITMDKIAPAAYQIMAMLMNYRRTVDDFGHCSFDGRNPYGFDLVSHCVGNDRYEGPCTDQRYPVACADHSCRATYIDCLRALSEMETSHSGVSAVGALSNGSFKDLLGGKDDAVAPSDSKEEETIELSFRGDVPRGLMLQMG